MKQLTEFPILQNHARVITITGIVLLAIVVLTSVPFGFAYWDIGALGRLMTLVMIVSPVLTLLGTLCTMIGLKLQQYQLVFIALAIMALSALIAVAFEAYFYLTVMNETFYD